MTDKLSREGQAFPMFSELRLWASSDVQNFASLLKSNDGPVAQVDRAAVS